MWLIPTGITSSNKLDQNNTYNKYIYGTIGNIAQWYNTSNGGNNTKYGGNGQGGWFGSILGQVGWQCMITGKGWVSTLLVLSVPNL